MFPGGNLLNSRAPAISTLRHTHSPQTCLGLRVTDASNPNPQRETSSCQKQNGGFTKGTTMNVKTVIRRLYVRASTVSTGCLSRTPGGSGSKCYTVRGTFAVFRLSLLLCWDVCSWCFGETGCRAPRRVRDFSIVRSMLSWRARCYLHLNTVDSYTFGLNSFGIIRLLVQGESWRLFDTMVATPGVFVVITLVTKGHDNANVDVAGGIKGL